MDNALKRLGEACFSALLNVGLCFLFAIPVMMISNILFTPTALTALFGTETMRLSHAFMLTILASILRLLTWVSNSIPTADD